MSSLGSRISEDLFQCSVCLGVFTQPVSLPCGHTFCLSCVQTQWMTTGSPHCPRCSEVFPALPELCENSFADEMARQIRRQRGKTTVGHHGARVAVCDLCPAARPAHAVKSCLVCLLSYCERHVGAHMARFTKHTLVQPWHPLEDRMCRKHERPLELFCRYDQTCVCVLCTDTEHQSHHAVPVEREWAERKTKLLESQSEIRQMIQERLKKTDEIKKSIQMSKENTDREVAESVVVFAALVRCVERSQAELLKLMEEKQEAAERQGEELIRDLETEVAKLKFKDSELERLIHSKDYFYLLQASPSLSPAPPTTDWSQRGLSTRPCLGLLRGAASHVEELLRVQIQNITARELEEISQYAVDLTLDPSTANPWLQVCAGGRSVRDGQVQQEVPDGPQRFDTAPCVLAREPISRGRSYWEVEVANKTAWDLGVARQSVNRKGVVTLSPQDGYWAICLRRGRDYRACDSESVLLPLRVQPQRVGIYVSYDDGQVSFYDPVSCLHIFSFTGQNFTESLQAFFNPDMNESGDNGAPLTLRPVRPQDNKPCVTI